MLFDASLRSTVDTMALGQQLHHAFRVLRLRAVSYTHLTLPTKA